MAAHPGGRVAAAGSGFRKTTRTTLIGSAPVAPGGEPSTEAAASLRKRCAHHQIDDRRRLVAGHETFAEFANEVIVRLLRVFPGDITEALLELALHVESRNRPYYAFHLLAGEQGIVRSPEVDADAADDQGHVRLLVNSDR